MTLHLSNSQSCMDYFKQEQINLAKQSAAPPAEKDLTAQEHVYHPPTPTPTDHQNQTNNTPNTQNTPDPPVFPDNDTGELSDTGMGHMQNSPASVHTAPNTPTEPIAAPPCSQKPPNIYDPSDRNRTQTFLQWVNNWSDWGRARNQELSKACPIRGEDGVIAAPIALEENLYPDDLSLLEHLSTDPNFGPGWDSIPKSEQAEIALMERLNKIKGCPLSVFDDVVAWAKEHLQCESSIAALDNIIPLLRSREVCLSHFEIMAHAKPNLPVTKDFHLEACDGKVSLTKVTFLSSLYNMLTDVELVQDNTLLLNGDTPYANPIKKPPIYQDFNTGSRYIESHYHLKKDEIDVPLGIINFIDQSVYDRGDRLATEMVAFTLALFNRATRNQPHAWRSLGSIPNFKRVDHKSADEKAIDYHLIMVELLADIHTIQSSTSGVLWPLMYNKRFYMIRLKPYQLCVLGDTPGLNAQAGKFKGPQGSSICRYCDSPKNQMSDPWHRGRLVTQSDVIGWQANPVLLQQHSYKKVDIAWNYMCFGGCKYGIHGCIPGEIVHALQLGIMPRVVDGLFCTKADTVDQQKAKAKAKSKLPVTEESRASLKNVVEEISKKNKQDDTKERIKNGAFGGQAGREVNYIAKRLGREGQHQSDRDMPSLNFSQGITNRSKTTASEQQGIMFLTNMILCSSYALKEGCIMDRITGDKLDGYVNILELLLCFEEFLKTTRTDGIKRRDLPAIVYFVCVLLDSIKIVVDRQVGNGMDLIKFHLIVHMVTDDIPRFASPANISGSAGECQFKPNFKLPASTGQLRDTTFDQFLYIRKYQHMVIHRCAQRVRRAKARAERSEKSETISIFHANNARDNLQFGAPLNQEDKVREGDLANNRGGDGLSSTVYRAQMVRNKLDPNSKFEPDIVFCGKQESARGLRFHSPNTELIGLDGKSAGVQNCRGLGSFNESFRKLLARLGPVVRKMPDFLIPIFSELRKDYEIYRADPCSQFGATDSNDAEWNDWAIFRFKVGGVIGEYPGQLIGYVHFDTATAAAYNSVWGAGTVDKSGGGHVLAELTQNALKGILDPTIELDPEQQMQPNSSIFFWERKEDVGGSPPVRCIPVSAVTAPVAAYADFAPEFVHNKDRMICKSWVTDDRVGAYIFVRPRKDWASLFVNTARKAYREHNKEQKEAKRDRDNNKRLPSKPKKNKKSR